MAEFDEFQKLEQALIDAGRAIEYPRYAEPRGTRAVDETATRRDQPRRPIGL